MNRLFFRIVLASIFGTLLAGAQSIRLEGSETVAVRVIPQLAELYKSKHPEMRFSVSANGNDKAFEALLNDEAGIGMSSRELTPAEEERFSRSGVEISRWHVATDVFVLVVNADNPVEQLTAGQVRSIFTGDVSDWWEVGGQPGKINLLLPGSGSGSHADFKRVALDGRPFGKSVFVKGSTVPQAVAADVSGIGWTSPAYAGAKGLKVLKVDGHSPLGGNALSYPYLRKLWCFTRQASGTPSHDFLEWITTAGEARERLWKIGFLTPEKQAD